MNGSDGSADEGTGAAPDGSSLLTESTPPAEDLGLVLASGDEAGTPPDDRSFRPDIQGLRALAVTLVVLYHAQLSGIPGGYVGVDVFFVLSGFVITGLLLRERTASTGTSLLNFYARRARRILPAATVVIIATVVATYVWLGFVRGNQVANDGRWASVFLSNYHSIIQGSDYFGAQSAVSPLVHYWSLAVEEQFYLVFPVLFLVVAAVKRPGSLRMRISVLLGVVMVASLAFSVIQTHHSPINAYYSPFTRAWELALGAFVASVGPAWKKIPSLPAALIGWVGVLGIVTAALLYSRSTPYPGIAVALPVIATALVIVAGFAAPRFGPEIVFGRWLPLEIGAISFSLYLWHFPLLVIPEEHAGHMLSLTARLLFVGLAVLLAFATYRLVENPIRHATFLSTRRGLSIGLGAALIAISLVVCSILISNHQDHTVVKPSLQAATATRAELARQIKRAVKQTTLPSPLIPPLAEASTMSLTSPKIPATCIARTDDEVTIPPSCVFGDRHSKQTIALYGDSQAQMWTSAFLTVATTNHLKLVILVKDGCAPWLKLYYAETGALFTQCDTWHRWATAKLISLHPVAIFITGGPGITAQPTQVLDSASAMLRSLKPTKASLAVLSNIPWFDQFPGPTPPNCLAQNATNLQVCNIPVSTFTGGENGLFRTQLLAASKIAGASFVNLDSLFCTTATCPVVVNHRIVYQNNRHTTAAYSRYVGPAMSEILAPQLRTQTH